MKRVDMNSKKRKDAPAIVSKDKGSKKSAGSPSGTSRTVKASTFIIATGEIRYSAPSEIEGSIGSLPTAVFAMIIRHLCFYECYDSVDCLRYRDDVLPLLLAVPNAYARLRWNADFSYIFGQARQEMGISNFENFRDGDFS